MDILDAGRIPVVSTVAPDPTTAQVLNVNADTAASALAVALGAHKLVVLTDVEGLYAQLARPRLAALAPVGVRRSRSCCRVDAGHGAEDGGLPARGARRRAAGARHRRPRSRTRCCSRSSPTRASAPWSCPTRDREAPAMTRPRPDAPAAPCWSATTAPCMASSAPPQRVLARGEGCYVWDADGTRYLDLLAGIAVNALGHAHPALVAAVSRPGSRRSAHVSNFFATEPADRAGRAAARAGRRAVRLGGLLLQLRHRGERGRVQAGPPAPAGRASSPPRARFHGRTMGALALTGKPAYREPFEPLLPATSTHVPYGDADALRRGGRRRRRGGRPGADPGRGRRVAPPAGYLGRPAS